MRGFGRMGRVGGTTVYLHWSVVVIATIALLVDVKNVASTLFLVASYLGVLLLHEWGHARAARRKGYGVWSIELYPFHGLTRYDAPRSQYDACVVAWGGVLAQLAVGVPLVLWSVVFGFTTIGVVNAIVAIFGYLSLVWVALSLLPVAPLDGALAWKILPHLWRRRRWLRPRTKRPDVDREKRLSKGGWVH
jgi:Zn-dependent protease